MIGGDIDFTIRWQHWSATLRIQLQLFQFQIEETEELEETRNKTFKIQVRFILNICCGFSFQHVLKHIKIVCNYLFGVNVSAFEYLIMCKEQKNVNSHLVLKLICNCD